MAETGRLQDRVAIVTGASRGIGAAIAERFVREGARVMLADIDNDAGREHAAKLAKLGTVKYRPCNVAERLDIHNTVASTVDAFGSVDVLVNNAGIVSAGDFLDVTEEDFDRVLSVNLKGAFLFGQAVARQMIEQIKAGRTPGTIINMSSINAVVALPNQVAYSVSKGGVGQLTKVMALSLATHGIRVNAIGPGSIMTDMLRSVADDKAARHRVLSRTPLGRIGEAAEIAGVAVFLASDDASYITGQTIYADGGRLPLNYTVPVVE
jgi:NAD(P)-dependent dehydrogenase (short-subunit alcohol dehydrogenase family)